MKENYYPETMTIRLPSFLYRNIVAEVSKRNFRKKNGERNDNVFLNRVLSNMLAYRAYKKDGLRSFLERNVKSSITESMQEKILDLLAESFDFLYFDESEYKCTRAINIRFDVANADLFAKLFVRLDICGIKRSTYLRNLIHEYFTLSEYQKERICFNEEYTSIYRMLSGESIFQFQHNNTVIKAYAAALEYSVKHEHWYLLYFEPNNYTVLHTILLCEITNILPLYIPIEKPSAAIAERVNNLINTDEFDTSNSFDLGGNDDA